MALLVLAACSRRAPAIVAELDAAVQRPDAAVEAIDSAKEAAAPLEWYLGDGRPNIPPRRDVRAALGPFAAPWQVCELALDRCDSRTETCTCDFRWDESVAGGRVRQVGWVRVPHGDHLAVRSALGWWVERDGLLRGREWAGNGDGWWTHEVSARTARVAGNDVDATARIDSRVCTCCGGCRNATPGGTTYYGHTLSDDGCFDVFLRCRVDAEDRPRCAVVVADAGLHAPPFPASILRATTDDRVVIQSPSTKGDETEYAMGL